MAEFFKIYRKKGVSETIETLYSFKKKAAKQTVFFREVKKRYGYLNSFFRVRKELIKKEIIKYRLDEDNEKVIYLTDKGKEIYKMIKEIEKILNSSDENEKK
ncbi:MAG: hypothetical protein ACTSRZ_13410 [Promethearchaeota archaeon]